MTAFDLFNLPDIIGRPLAVVLIDLLLAADNALVIALVCLSVAPDRLRPVLLFGTLGAVVLRIGLTLAAGGLLLLPGLKLAGGVLLGLLALNLMQPAAHPPPAARTGAVTNLLTASLLVMLVDVAMSLDNVLALAAVAGDRPLMLGAGLVLSVSILMFGSAAVAALLRRHAELARLGVALLGWIGGRMALSDHLIAGWVGVQAPALPFVVPALAATYLYLLGGEAPAPAPVTVAVPVAVPVAMPAPDSRPPAPRKQPRLPRKLPAPPVPRVSPTAPQVEAAGPKRSELVAFIAMFAVAGVLLTLAIIWGGAEVK